MDALTLLGQKRVSAGGLTLGSFLRFTRDRSTDPIRLSILLRSGQRVQLELFEVIGDSLVGTRNGVSDPAIIPFHAIDLLEIVNA